MDAWDTFFLPPTRGRDILLRTPPQEYGIRRRGPEIVFFPLSDTVLQRRLIRGRVRVCEVRPVFLLLNRLLFTSSIKIKLRCASSLFLPYLVSPPPPPKHHRPAADRMARLAWGKGYFLAKKNGNISSSMSFPLTLHAGMHTSRKSNERTSLRPRGKKKI